MLSINYPSIMKPNLITSSLVKNGYSKLRNEKHPFAIKELFNIIFGLKENQSQQGVTIKKSLKSNLLEFISQETCNCKYEFTVSDENHNTLTLQPDW